MRLYIFLPCIDCELRKFEEFVIWDGGYIAAERCIHAPVCKKIDGEKPISQGGDEPDGFCK